MKFKALITALVAFLAVAVAGTALAEDGKVKGPFWNAVHAAGSIVYKDGSSQSYNWDRGKITALSSSSISIERRDKVALTFAIDASTLVRNDHASYTLADLKAGLRATIVSQNGTAVVIRHIRGDGAPSGNDPSQVQLPLSKSVYGDGTVLFADGTSQAVHYDRGQITAKDASSLTIKRPDGKSVTLTYDAQTLVREEGEVYSVDKLEVGERAMFFSESGKAVLIRCVSKAKDAGAKQAPAPAPAATASK